ncbi:MAG: leucine-rich repeat protein [Bacteroidales bacterium]|nr:leucine-rich repeat protein [Bacteroidales bacterium]
MKVCKYCGNKFKGNFCPRCGAAADDNDFVNDAAGDVSLSGETRTDGTTGTAVKRRRTLAVVLPVVIVLFVAVALILVFSVGSCTSKYDDEADIPQTSVSESDAETTDPDYAGGGTSDAGGVSEIYEGLSYTKKGSTYEVSYAGDGTETEIVIPSSFEGVSVTSIASSAFSGLSAVESVAIPDSVTSVGEYAFRGCKSLTEITIPQSVKSIGAGAFSGCSSLESITLPFVGESSSASSASKTTLFGYVFGTSSYTGGVSTKQYYSYSSSSTYYIPSSLKSVTITGGKILYGSFYNCSNITYVSITGSVSSLDTYVFEGCTSIKEIYYGVSSSGVSS